MTSALLLAAVLVPLAAGLAASLLPAFGWLPALGGTGGLFAWRALFAEPGLARALALTLWTGFGATLLSLAAALAIAALAPRRALGGWIAPVLATPPAALAIGLLFLLAPSGWIARLAAPLAGWRTPPVLATVGDPFGLALLLGLWVKETPFLLLMTLAALPQAGEAEALRVAATLGQGRLRGWGLAVLPRVWPQLRWPVLATLAFAVSSVDMAVVLGPSDPPPLAVLVVRLAASPELHDWFPAAAGAVLVSATALIGLGLMRAAEAAVAALGRRAIWSGGQDVPARRWRDWPARGAGVVACGLAGVLAVLGLLPLAALAVWSVARVWRFPAALPQAWSVAAWTAADALARPALDTLWIGVGVTALALAIAVAWLHRPGSRLLERAALAPLLLPQLGVLFGLQVLLVRLRLDGGALAVVWVQLLFVLPYVLLALAGPWRALDPRYGRAAACLGAAPARVLLRITLPLLARPLAAAAAIGFAVSAGLYLPTVFAGGGRISTLATEAVALSGGGDRRTLGALGLAQAALPILFYLLAVRRPRA